MLPVYRTHGQLLENYLIVYAAIDIININLYQSSYLLLLLLLFLLLLSLLLLLFLLASQACTHSHSRSWNTHGPRHVKACLRAYADSEGPDHPAHPHSLIRIFTVRQQNHWTLQNVWIESKSPDDTLHMRRMIWICAFCVCSKALFRLTRYMWYCIIANLYCSCLEAIFAKPKPGIRGSTVNCSSNGPHTNQLGTVFMWLHSTLVRPVPGNIWIVCIGLCAAKQQHVMDYIGVVKNGCCGSQVVVLVMW